MGNEIVNADSPNQLVPADLLALGKKNETQFEMVAAATSWLPRIQLMGASTKLVTSNKIRAGMYALVAAADKFVDLGDQVDVLVLAYRSKAMKIDANDIVSVYDPESAIFKKIQAESEIKDSGNMYGPEYLLYVKQEKTFATYFLNSVTARREASNLHALMGAAATLKSHFIEPKKSKYSWWGPLFVKCSTPFEIPALEIMKEQIEKFINPPKDEREPVKADGSDRER